MRQHEVEVGGIRHQPARRGDHHLGVDLDRFFECPSLVTTVGVRAVEVVDLADATSGKFLDLAAQFDEGVAQVIGQALAQRALARTAQTDQGNAGMARPRIAAGAQQFGQCLAGPAQVGFAAVLQQFADQQPLGRGGGDVAQQFGQRAVQRLRHLQQHQDGGIAGAVFEVGQVALRDVRRSRHRLAGHALTRTQGAHPLAQCHQKGVARLAHGHGRIGLRFGRHFTLINPLCCHLACTPATLATGKTPGLAFTCCA